MIKLGKLPNGVALFDMIGKTRIILQTIHENDILACFDTSAYDKDNLDENWLIKENDILRNENNEICEILDKLYDSYIEKIENNRNGFIFVNKNNKDQKIYLFHEGVNGNIELLYPSEDDIIDNTTWLGIIKYKNIGYSLTFHKSTKNINRKSVYLKSENSRIPELFPLYKECFDSLCKIATTDFEKVNEEFNIYVNGEQQNSKQLRLTNNN